MNQNFHIYRSSAGSGKTYTLALNFIALALKGDKYGYEDYYRKILAITFTNKAASEMKERVLEYLDSLSKKKDADQILDWLINDTNFDEDTIFQRSAVIHKHVLHNYADLGISTIDKFTYKIVRTFASDLGIAHNFDIEMDNYKIIQPVVALLLSRISYSGGALSSTLLNFAIEKAEDGKSINIEHDLEVFSQAIFNENFDQYHSGEILKVDACIQIKEFLQKDKQRLKLEVYNLSSRVSLFFEEASLEKDFFRKAWFC